MLSVASAIVINVDCPVFCDSLDKIDIGDGENGRKARCYVIFLGG